MISIHISSNIADILVNLERATTDFRPTVQATLQRTGDQGVTTLSDAAPMGTGRYFGGHLKDSFETRSAEMSVQVVTVQATKLQWVVFGTGVAGPLAHMITPRVKQAMWWEDEPYTAPHPMHAVRGQKPFNFVSPVLADLVNYSVYDMTQGADDIASIIAGKS